MQQHHLYLHGKKCRYPLLHMRTSLRVKEVARIFGIREKNPQMLYSVA
jgi:hypothetical protein